MSTPAPSTPIAGKKRTASEIEYCSWSANERRVFIHHHVWTIDHIKERIAETPVNQKIKSRDFTVMGSDKEGKQKRFTFGLRAALNGILMGENPATEEHYKDFIGVMLRNKNPETCNVKFSVCLLGSDMSHHWPNAETRASPISANHGKWFRKAFKKENIFKNEEKLLRGGKLTLRISVEVHCPDRKNRGKKAKMCFQQNSAYLSNKLGPQLLKARKEKAFSDVVLVTKDNKEIKCHKFILASRSDVFNAMFSHETKESLSGKVVLDDIDSDVVEEMVNFLYTDQLSNQAKSKEIVGDLLSCADRYNLVHLKHLCEEALIDALDVENACSCLILSHMHKAKLLECSVTQFIVYNLLVVKKSEGWKQFSSCPPQVLTHLLEAIAEQIL